MIKVNLRRSGAASPSTSVSQVAYTAIDEGVIDLPGLIIRVVVLLMAPAVLIYIETAKIRQLTAQLVQVNSEMSTLQAAVTQKEAKLAENGDLQAKAKELANKLQILMKLSKLRLREVKALDYIQSVIPEKVWLTDLKIANAKLELKGAALTDDELTLFVKGLENSAFFTNVLLVQAQEQKSAQGTFRQFEINSSVEGGE